MSDQLSPSSNPMMEAILERLDNLTHLMQNNGKKIGDLEDARKNQTTKLNPEILPMPLA